MEGKKLKILKEFLGDTYNSGTEQLFYCPECKHHKKKLSVNISKDKFKCWVCDYRGASVRRLVRRYGTFTQQQEWNKLVGRVDISSFESRMAEGLLGLVPPVQEEVVPLPEEFLTLTSKNGSLGSLPAKRYLFDRGIGTDDILKWKVGYCPTGQYADRIIVPSFNMEGKVNYFTARSYNGNWRKYLNPPAGRDIVFNELYVDWESDLSIVEGVFDAIVAGNAVPLLGSSLREDSRLIRKIVEYDTPVYVALDADAEKRALNLIKSLTQYDVELYKVNIEPYSDVGEMTRQEYAERRTQAVPMTFENLLTQAIASI
jgi:DNA primase